MLSIMPIFKLIGEYNGTPCNGDIIIDKATNEIKWRVGGFRRAFRERRETNDLCTMRRKL